MKLFNLDLKSSLFRPYFYWSSNILFLWTIIQNSVLRISSIFSACTHNLFLQPEILLFSCNIFQVFMKSECKILLLLSENAHRDLQYAFLLFYIVIILLFTTAMSRPALVPTQPRIQWVSVALSLGLRRPGRRADHSPPCSDEVKNAWSYISTHTIRLHGVVLSYGKHKDNFTITFTFIQIFVGDEKIFLRFKLISLSNFNLWVVLTVFSVIFNVIDLLFYTFFLNMLQ
jgi:hypothetical protein